MKNLRDLIKTKISDSENLVLECEPNVINLKSSLKLMSLRMKPKLEILGQMKTKLQDYLQACERLRDETVIDWKEFLSVLRVYGSYPLREVFKEAEMDRSKQFVQVFTQLIEQEEYLSELLVLLKFIVHYYKEQLLDNISQFNDFRNSLEMNFGNFSLQLQDTLNSIRQRQEILGRTRSAILVARQRIASVQIPFQPKDLQNENLLRSCQLRQAQNTDQVHQIA